MFLYFAVFFFLYVTWIIIWYKKYTGERENAQCECKSRRRLSKHEYRRIAIWHLRRWKISNPFRRMGLVANHPLVDAGKIVPAITFHRCQYYATGSHDIAWLLSFAQPAQNGKTELVCSNEMTTHSPNRCTSLRHHSIVQGFWKAEGNVTTPCSWILMHREIHDCEPVPS